MSLYSTLVGTFYGTTHGTGLVTHYQRFVIILLFACSCGMSALNSIKRFQIGVKMEYFFFFSKIAFDAFWKQQKLWLKHESLLFYCQVSVFLNQNE